MFRTKEKIIKTINESGSCYELSNDEIRELQLCLLEIYKDILAVCKKYSLTILLSGGTALGAIRHQGFIPWDDDLDLMMPRKHYQKFFKLFKKEMGEKYHVLAPNFEGGSQVFFGRVYKKNTTKLSITNIGTTYPKGVFVDVFPIDYAPNSKFLQIVKGFYINVLRYIGVSTYHFTHKNGHLKKFLKQNKYSYLSYKFRLLLGFIFSFRSYKTWFDLFDKHAQGKASQYVTIACGRKHYIGEIVSKDVIFPARSMEFEGLNVSVPNKIEDYLSNLYGDYTQIPPVDKRERHPVFKLDLKNDYME